MAPAGGTWGRVVGQEGGSTPWPTASGSTGPSQPPRAVPDVGLLKQQGKEGGGGESWDVPWPCEGQTPPDGPPGFGSSWGRSPLLAVPGGKDGDLVRTARRPGTAALGSVSPLLPPSPRECRSPNYNRCSVPCAAGRAVPPWGRERRAVGTGGHPPPSPSTPPGFFLPQNEDVGCSAR